MAGNLSSERRELGIFSAFEFSLNIDFQLRELVRNLYTLRLTLSLCGWFNVDACLYDRLGRKS